MISPLPQLNGKSLDQSSAYPYQHINVPAEPDYRTSIYLDILTEETAQVNGWFQEAPGFKE
ncbi:hypothetical protein P40081_01540 [Paenibacillus sp. FSL P4-0081]|jgi:hypothetical protein|uniref:hypothetical protein n=1 Tax=Paenibacillus sp. FSL R10-2199 TaxID=2975348 RepID=UPI0004F64D2D|nr:hypothetical protein [Paenibacillus sp. FSL H8-0259]AIQ27029.1 hypothetical protein P40081_01540 [Paenibacillus sp. FSL P4-0081]